MTQSLRVAVFTFVVSFALLLVRETGHCARPDAKLVVRIEKASVTRKGDRIVIQATGMGRTAAAIRGGGQLLPRGQKHEPKDGLLEYDLYYVPPRDYSGDKLKAVKASFVESNVPPGVKGVRIYAEFNERNAMLPELKVRGRKPKEGFVATEEQLAVRKKEPAVTEERPKPKKEEVASRTEVQEKKSSSRSWNPFHRKPAPTPQPTPALARSKKPEPTPKKEEIARAKREPTSTPMPEKPKRKRGLLSWNPFHREAAPAPRTEIVVETKRPAPSGQKPEVPPVPAPKKQEIALERETPPPQIKKKSRGWNLNPFHRKRTEPEVNAVPPPPPQKPAPTPKREVTTVKKTEPAPKTEETPPKKEEVKKKKKKRWEDLNPLNWNPFKHKSPEPETER